MEWDWLSIFLRSLYVIPASLIFVSFAITHIIALKTKDEQNALALIDWFYVVLGAFCPLLNVFMIFRFSDEIFPPYFKAKKILAKHRRQTKLTKQHPHIQLIDLFEKVEILYRENANKNEMEFQNYIHQPSGSVGMDNFILELQYRNAYVKKNALHPDIQSIVETNELPFSYVSSLFSEHPQLLKNPESDTFQKVLRIINLYTEKVKQVEIKEHQIERELRNLNNQKKTEQRKKEQAEKEKRELEELQITQQSKERVNQDLDLILEVVENNNKKR